MDKSKLTKNTLHPVEAAWRQFRNIRGMLEVLQEGLQARDSYLRLAKSQVPTEVVLPVAAARVILNHRVWGAKADVHDLSSVAVSLHVWAAYRESKTIFEVEPQLAECLTRTTWPTDTPTAALALRSLCPVLALPHNGTIRYVAITYDHLAPDPNSAGLLMLNLSLLTEWLWTPCGRLSLAGDDLGACLRAARPFMRSAKDLLPFAEEPEWIYQISGLVLTVLLYLAGEADIVRIVHPGEKLQVKPSLQRREPERFKDLREPKVHAVGKSFTRAIERWEIEQANERGELTGRTVRPHTRRAHAHLYWTGEGRTSPRVRFLLPVSVKGDKLVEEPQVPSVTSVR
jgi:hypothetical protein